MPRWVHNSPADLFSGRHSVLGPRTWGGLPPLGQPDYRVVRGPHDGIDRADDRPGTAVDATGSITLVLSVTQWALRG